MIDQIRIDRRTSVSGKEYEAIRIWVAGIPFSTDNSVYVEQVVRRLSSEHGIDIVDARLGGRIPQSGGDVHDHISLALGLIREAKGGAGDEAYVTDHLDAAERHILSLVGVMSVD